MARASDRHIASLPDRDATWHSPIIAALVASYTEPVYIEIGVHEGATLARCVPFCSQAHGVDVTFSNLRYGGVEVASLWEIPSDDFWPRYDELGGEKADVIFVDGDHSFEQSSRDVQNALLHLAPHGTLLIHDTWPQFTEDTDERICGEVYRTVELLQRDATLAVFTIERFPGLTIVNQPAEVLS